MSEFDLVVIGGGSGGVRAARMAATRGMKVAIVEDTHWGGTCVNVGCVPKKLMVYASHYSHDFADAEAVGWNVSAGDFNWPKFIALKNTEISRLNGIYTKMLGNAGVEVINGRGHILSANQVRVNDQILQAKRILIAVGGEPSIPDVPGKEHCISSDQIFFLDELPASILLVGGGFIALEFACILAGMGSKVTLAYRGEALLRGFDDDLRSRMVALLEAQGVSVRLQTDVESVQQASNGEKLVTFTNDNGELSVAQVFYATGRKPRTNGLWDSSVNIETNRNGDVLVDDNFETAQPGIFALGDVVGRMRLTPVALAEAMALLDYWLVDKPVAIDYSAVPVAVFTQPNLASVGLTEQQAQQQNVEYRVFESDFKHMKHSLTGRNERVYLKMIVDVSSDRVIGLHTIGPDVGEMVQTAAVALRAGATKADFDNTIGIHPTMAEELVTMRTARD